jgi:hypothetical protein
MEMHQEGIERAVLDHEERMELNHSESIQAPTPLSKATPTSEFNILLVFFLTR